MEYVEQAQQMASDAWDTAAAVAEDVWFSGKGLEVDGAFLPYGVALIAITLSTLAIGVLWHKFRANIVQMWDERSAPMMSNLWRFIPERAEAASAAPSPAASEKKAPAKKTPTPKRGRTPKSKTPMAMKAKSPASSKRSASKAMKKK